jgi:NitT/TauT family transport system permease protein
LLKGEKFLPMLGSTFFRVIMGMVISVPLGLAFGIAAGLDKRASAFFHPLFSLISATPVMSVILIAFLFLGSERTPIFTAFLMVFPVMAANSAEGIRRVDPLLVELFKVYQMTGKERLRHLYIPSIMPFVLGGLKSSLSLCWKVVVAAEVLVQPFRSLGTGMQQAKAQLETPELFAWTLATVIAASLCQGIVSLFMRKAAK